MMCEYLTPPASKNFSELPATESARSFSFTERAVFRASIGSWIVTVHPSRPGRGAEPVDGAAPRANQRGGDLTRSEQPDDPIRGVAFGYPAEIELDARLVEGDRLDGDVQNPTPSSAGRP